jgi:cytidylate kinase
MIIAIDGPAASGKGTIARRLASHFGLPHLDTGLLYRGVGKAMLDQGLDLADEAQAERVALALDAQQLDDDALRGAQIAWRGSLRSLQRRTAPWLRSAMGTFTLHACSI